MWSPGTWLLSTRFSVSIDRKASHSSEKKRFARRYRINFIHYLVIVIWTIESMASTDRKTSSKRKRASLCISGMNKWNRTWYDFAAPVRSPMRTQLYSQKQISTYLSLFIYLGIHSFLLTFIALILSGMYVAFKLRLVLPIAISANTITFAAGTHSLFLDAFIMMGSPVHRHIRFL